MPEPLHCPACTVELAEPANLPAAFECPDCGTLLLPNDPEYMAKLRREHEAMLEEIAAVPEDYRLPRIQAYRLYHRLGEIIGVSREKIDEILKRRYPRQEDASGSQQG